MRRWEKQNREKIVLDKESRRVDRREGKKTKEKKREERKLTINEKRKKRK